MNTRPHTVRFASIVALTGLAQIAAAQCPVPAPTGLSASHATYCGSVFLDWNGVTNAIAYDVWRNTTNNPNTAGWVGGTVAATQFTDLTAEIGTQYYYWVSAERVICSSGYMSSVATGYRGQDPAAPANVAASDGSVCGAVRVTWTQSTPLGGAVASYTIYRNTVNLYLTSTAIGTAGGSAREFSDFTAAPATTYYYWVRAENACGTSASGSDPGVASSLAAPSNDSCAGAINVGSGGTFVGSTVCATNDGGSACGAVGSPSRDVWYRFVAPFTGTLHADTCGAAGSFDTVLSIHVGACPASAATQYICNDDTCGALSSLDLPVSQGSAYLIRVAGRSSSDMGVYELHVGFTASSCYANCDQSTTPPALNVLDFSCFLNAFAAGQSYANCDHSTTPPVLNVLDFSCFLNAFAAGCSQ